MTSVLLNQPMSIASFSGGDGDNAKGVEAANKGLETASGTRKNLFALQSAAADLPAVECQLQHSFIDGVYVRTIFIPAGTVVVGKIHKHSHANILSQGEVIVVTEEGGRQHLKGPLTMTSPAGCKRAVLALTDTTWTTIHATEETDLAAIERYVIAGTYEEFEQFRLESTEKIEVKPCLG